MHSLAIALKHSGYNVSGSDDEIFDPARSRLKREGLLPPAQGWDTERINESLDAVILGMHARASNPELKKAQELGLKIYSFPEFLHNETKNKKRVVVSGSHGKTTITSMIMHVLKKEGMTFDYLVGSAVPGFDNMAYLNPENEIAVFEGDEYLSSCLDPRPKFHLYKPSLALISGISWDHINVFPDFDDYVNQFRVFVETMPPDSTLAYCADDKLLSQMVADKGKHLNLEPYNTHKYHISGGNTFLVHEHGETQVRVFGRHNMQNIDGARIICRELGVSANAFYEAIADFGGPAKRLQLVMENDTLAVYSDFAHSPSKVQATINAVLEKYPGRTIVACLELHTYSSMNKHFLENYSHSMDKAGLAVIYYNHAAVKHKQLDIMKDEEIRQGFKHNNMYVFNEKEKLEEFLIDKCRQNTVLLLMSSGNFSGINPHTLTGW